MSATKAAPEVKNGFEVPKWAGKPPSGLHLDVMKDEKMVQKLMIDEKNCYFFGRNKDQCEFVIDHASCSRVHAVLLWHKHLNRSFLVDLNSTHGTFIGSIRLDPNKPQQLFIDTEFKFGASTRTYVLRERPQMNKHFPSILNNASSNLNSSSLNNSASEKNNEDNTHNDSLNNSNVTNLPESEAELENLTEFNTAHNKRIAQLVVDIGANGAPGTGVPVQVKRKKKSVAFIEDVDIINPEDIDPTIGRFRNMISTTIVIPNKKKRTNQLPFEQRLMVSEKRFKMSDKLHDSSDFSDEQSFTLYDEDEFESGDFGTIASNLGIKKLDLAPDVESYHQASTSQSGNATVYSEMSVINASNVNKYDLIHQIDKKKKYVKEAWPGKDPGHSHGAKLSLSPRMEQQEEKRLSTSPARNFLSEKPDTLSNSNNNTTTTTTTTSNNAPPKRLMI